MTDAVFEQGEDSDLTTLGEYRRAFLGFSSRGLCKYAWLHFLEREMHHGLRFFLDWTFEKMVDSGARADAARELARDDYDVK